MVAYLKSVVLAEGGGWEGAFRVRNLAEEVLGVFVGDNGGLLVDEQVCSTGMISVVMAVDEVCDRQVCNVANSILKLAAGGRRIVNEDNASRGDQDEGLVAAICDHISPTTEALDKVSLCTEIRTTGCSWEGSIDVRELFGVAAGVC